MHHRVEAVQPLVASLALARPEVAGEPIRVKWPKAEGQAPSLQEAEEGGSLLANLEAELEAADSVQAKRQLQLGQQLQVRIKIKIDVASSFR
eukprot:SAG31_NODE_1499_length_8091_cov_2.089590_5_plen_92_part_00